MHCCYFNGFYDWLTPQELHAQWNAVPARVKVGFPNGLAFPFILDTSFRELPNGIQPLDLANYFNGKRNVKKHVLGNLCICDLRGRICWSSNGHPSFGGEHWMLRSANITTQMNVYFPDPTIRVIADGLFVGVGPAWNQILHLPHRGHLTAVEAAENTFIGFLRSIVENVFAARDQLTPVVKIVMNFYHWTHQPVITTCCDGIYNMVRSFTEFIGDYRLNYLVG